MNKILYTKDDSKYNISFNGISLGSLVMLEDGYYNWFPINFNGSCISSCVLMDIYNKIEELNKEYNQQLNDYFNKN